MNTSWDSDSNGTYTIQEAEIITLGEGIRQKVNAGNYWESDSILVAKLDEFKNSDNSYGVIEIVIEHGYLMAATGRINNAIALQAIGDNEAGIDTLKSAIALNIRTGNTGSLIRNYYNLGNAYYKAGNLEEAELHFRMSYDLSESNGIRLGIMYNTSGLAKIRRVNNDYTGAIQLANEALLLSKEFRALEIELTATDILMTSKEEIGDYRGALEMRKQHGIISDSLWTIRSSKEVEEVRSSFAFSMLENQNKLLEQSLLLAEEQNRRQNQFLFLLIVIILAISAFYVMLGRKNRRITEKNSRMEQLNVEKDILTKVIVHDMRNPLTTLLGALELLSSDANLTKSQDEYVNIASKSGAKLKYMINGFLSAVQIQQESVSDNFVQTKIDDLTSDIIDSMSSSAELKGITIKSNLQNLTRNTYPEYYSHIVENLLSNAIKFSDTNSIVTVQLAAIDDERWSLQVIDQGPGFSDYDLENVFKMFRKLSAKPTSGEESTGLGLFLVRILTTKINGRVDILSELGRGSTIVCTFNDKK